MSIQDGVGARSQPDPVLCADGVLRESLGQWQGYFAGVYRDSVLVEARLREVPDALRVVVAAHVRSLLVLHWVQAVMHCTGLDERRGMIQACPNALRDAVKDHVAMLFAGRRGQRVAGGGQ
jgi:hypothetical protein